MKQQVDILVKEAFSVMFSDDLRFEKGVTSIVVAKELTSSVRSLTRFLFHKCPVFR